MADPEQIDFAKLIAMERPDRMSELTGVSFNTYRHHTDDWDDAEHCTFVLNGVSYTAVEDPSDGYRSSLRELLVGGECTNMFPPVLVRLRLMESGEDNGDGFGYDKNDALMLVDAFTAQPVLIVGTTNTDDYYPSFIARFDPTAMVYNQPRKP